MHALRPLLRGVKITGFLLAVVSFASFAALQQSRPVGAESFLLKTVQCALGSILSNACTQTDGTGAQIAYSGSSSHSASSGQGASPQGTGQGNGNGKNTPSTAGSQTAVGTTDSLAMPPIDPINVQSRALNTYAALPDTSLAISDAMQQSEGASQQVFPYGIRSAAAADAGSLSFVKPSQEGWQVLGVAWYWWLLLIGGMTLLVWRIVRVIRRRRAKILLYS